MHVVNPELFGITLDFLRHGLGSIWLPLVYGHGAGFIVVYVDVLQICVWLNSSLMSRKIDECSSLAVVGLGLKYYCLGM